MELDRQRLARTFTLALATVRVLAGSAEVLAPRAVLRLLGNADVDPSRSPGAVLGYRMKGGRDVALGLGALLAARRGAPSERGWTEAAVVVDGLDGVAVLADSGQALRPWVARLGGPLGFAVGAAAAWAARNL